MPIRRRRYDADRIRKIMFNPASRRKENESYTIVNCNKGFIISYIHDYTDYVILSIINDFRNHKVDKNKCYKLIDKVEGYYYAFEESFINASQLYQKLTEEIMIQELRKKNWNYIAIYKGDMNDLY